MTPGQPELELCYLTLRSPPLAAYLEAAAGAGFDTVTMSPAMAEDAGWPRRGGRETAERVAAAGLRVSVVDPLVAGMPGVVPRPEADPAHLRMLEYSARECLELAAELGAIVNAAHVFGTSATPVTQLTDAVGSFAGLAEAAGVGLAIEFVPGTGIPDLATATAIVTAVGTGRAGIMFDTWHFYRSGGTLEDLAAVPAEHIVAINLSDATAADLGGGHVPGTSRRLPGDGDLPLAQMLTLLLAGRPGLRAAVEAPTAELRGLPLPQAALLARQALSALVDQVR
jgi:sugar phosphate isomerase/epimerase